MRRFVILAHEAPTDADVSLDDLPGAGRLDLLARCVTSALLLSHDIRGDVRVLLVVRDAFTVRFDGADLQGLNPDERSTAALIRRAIAGADEAVGHQAVETTPGVSVSQRDTEAILEAVADATLVQLHEDGTPIVDLDIPADPVFVLSDHRDLTAMEAELLADAVDARVSIGPRNLHADQAITVAHNYLDTDGYRRY